MSSTIVAKRLLLPAGLVLAGIAFLVGIHAYLGHWAAQPLPLAENASVVIERGASFAAVTEVLDAAGVVSPGLFALRAKQRRVLTSVRSGEYTVVPGDTPDSLLDRLVRGEVDLHRFRIVEGSTVAQLAARLRADERLRDDLADVESERLAERLSLWSPVRADGSGVAHAEGLFFPDTYHIPQGYRASALLLNANAKMAEVLAGAWAGRDAGVPYADAYEALIVASIVEKETGAAIDRPRIAGVFARRLRGRMRLQSDPTVIYGLGDAFDGDLKRTHLRATDNPYNTYRRDGLPPTPISLPGKAAIEATLNPAEEDALYFVSRGDGTSEFSTTLADHNAAVRRYQLRRRQ